LTNLPHQSLPWTYLKPGGDSDDKIFSFIFVGHFPAQYQSIRFMGKEHIKDLSKFLKLFPADIKKTALWLREFFWGLYPQANELIYDNYNALAVGWSPTDRIGHTFCSIAVGRTSLNVHFGFYW
jgi:hypothetical protein